MNCSTWFLLWTCRAWLGSYAWWAFIVTVAIRAKYKCVHHQWWQNTFGNSGAKETKEEKKILVWNKKIGQRGRGEKRSLWNDYRYLAIPKEPKQERIEEDHPLDGIHL